MEFILFVLLVTLVVLVIGIKTRVVQVERELRTNRFQMQELMQVLAKRAAAGVEPQAAPTEERPGTAAATPEPPPPAEAPAAFGGLTLEPLPPVVLPEVERPVIITPPPVATPEPEVVEEAAPWPQAVPEPAPPPPPPPPRRPGFLERNPDLEKFIGENLMNKIGIAVLVLGLGLLLRYAIGHGYIGEAAQTLIGIASGGVLLFLAHRLRDSFRAFSSVLVGGGLAVLYFSIAIAFQQYHIIGQTAAFAVMVGISALGVLLTLAYDRRELAVIALLGGFATPFMVSTGEGNFRVLFTYLLILNAGMLALANFKKWPIINILSFALTWLLFGVWAFTGFPHMEQPPVWAALGFGTAFYGVFFAMVLWYDLRHRTPFTPLDYSLFIGNTALYFGTGITFLSQLDTRLEGLLCVLLAAVNVVFALRYFRDQQVPRNLVYLLIGVVLTFISLAAPVQLKGDHITLFWAAEGALLVWFAHRSGIRLVERASLVVAVLMVISLIMDLQEYSAFHEPLLLPVVNRLFLTGAAVVISLVLQVRFWGHWAADHTPIHALRVDMLRHLYAVAAAVLGYVVGMLELDYQLHRVLPAGSVAMFEMVYNLLVVLLVDRYTRRAPVVVRYAVGGLFALVALLYTTWHYTKGMDQLRAMLAGGEGTAHMVAHYLAFALLVAVVLRMMQWSRAVLHLRSPQWNMYAWAMCTLLVVIASQELDHILLALQPATDNGFDSHHALYRARTAGYPILWGVGSFLFMTYGMKARLRMVRVIALTLFGITLVKLFLFDIRGASEGARVAAFISLGVLLLVVSFLYQKLKVLLKDDTDAQASQP
ncbi:MAG: DUF2339 domain-containing protein [Flavobacteriales bacterium]|nr:DUF2339 domain-containing protein [Flavobacteriales bacterium]